MDRFHIIWSLRFDQVSIVRFWVQEIFIGLTIPTPIMLNKHIVYAF
jgi:hypothetical protein